MAIDKYEYKVKTEEMLELMESGAFKRAAEIADTIDWRKVRNSAMLMAVSEIYEKSGDIFRSYEVLNLAYTRESESRNLLNRLCELAIKTGNVDEAIDYYDEFVNIAPKDPTQYVLRYKILKARRAPLEQQIEALIKFKRSEYIEEWAYELARKYQEAGMTAECIEECDDLILWFNEGKYVYKAMELKMQYKPLTRSQQERYNHRYERRDSVTEEIPNVEQYTQTKAANLSVKAKMEAIEKAEPVRIEHDYSGGNEFIEKDVAVSRDEPVYEETDFIEEKPATEEVVEEKTSLEVEVNKSLQKLNEKGIVQQMNLEDALMSLLHPDEYQKNLDRKAEEARNAEKEATVAEVESTFENANIPEYAHVLDEIESVIDVNLVNKMVDDANIAATRFDPDLEELKPTPIDDATDEIPLVEELDREDYDEFADFEEEEFLSAEDAEDFDDFEEEEFFLVEDAEDFDDFEEEEFLSKEDAEDFEEEEFLLEEDAEDFESLEEETVEETEEQEKEVAEKTEEPAEEQVEETKESVEDVLEEEVTEIEDTVNLQEEEVEMKETKNITPILPPDIQRLIDEIEGVLPEEPEKEDVTEQETFEEPHENMGEVTEQLRMDEDDFSDIEEVEEDIEEADDITDFEEAEDLEETDDFADFEEAEEDLEETADFADFEEAEEVLEETDDFADFEEAEEDLEEEDEFDGFDIDDDFSGFEEEDNLLSLFEQDAEDMFDESFDYDDLRNSLEKEFSPSFDEEEDEREIPDDDDIPDLLSATTPLSRKETAKLHATGKTAPLPVGELSDALSMSDTGFVVQGRYDLSAQSGIGTRAGLTEEQKKLFSYFVPVRGMSEQLVDVLEQDKNCTNRQGTSKTGNLLIIGNKGNGKTVLAVDVVKAIQKQRNISHGKVSIVTGESLNKKKVSEIFDKLYGGAIIIEKAGKMNEKTIMRLNKAMEKDTGELLVVLEEQRKPLDRMLSINREFRRKFTSRLEVPILINDELVTFGQSYAEENGYKIDEMGILALYSRIDSLQREDHFVTIAEVKEVMDEAIAHSQKGSAKKLVKKVFKRNTDTDNKVLLSENDFNI